jgi:arsenate reductase
MGQLNLESFDKIDIKNNPVTEAQLLEIYLFTSSYEAVFNKRAKKYKPLNLKDKPLTENEFKALILQEYTFLKRPVFIVAGEIFIGNDKKNIKKLIELLGKNK